MGAFQLPIMYTYISFVFSVLILLPPEAHGAINSIIRNVGQDFVFMWNRTSGNIVEVRWGLVDPVDNQGIKPQFIYVNKWANVAVYSAALDTPAASSYKGRVYYVGDLPAGRAWFQITNLSISDAKEYAVSILEGSVYTIYKMGLTVTVTPQFQPQPPLTQNIAEGQDLSVPCTAVGPPIPNITWVQIVGHVTKITGTGSATLRIPNIRRDQNGTYECQASNNPNENPVTAQTVVSVYFVEGDEIVLSCTADGYPPPSISWKKADGVIKAGHTVGGGTLRIPDAIKTDAGQYICTAKNAYDSREHTNNANATVIVKYQPLIMLEKLLNQTVNESDSLSIKCEADGNPLPTIKWKTPTGSVHTGNVYSIPSVSKSHAGTYTCTASNGIGRDAMTSIQVTVQYPPDIDASKSSLLFKAWNGKSIRLRCLATGLPAPWISWYKPTNQQITTGVNIVPGGSEVTVLTTADQGDYGQYKCRATNILGSDEQFINVIQLFPPGLVTINVIEVEALSMKITWNKPGNDGGRPVIGYKVEVSTKPPVFTVNTQAVITGLKANTQYTVKVYARNIAGYGQQLMKVITTKKQGKPGVPQLTISINDTAELFIRLTWTKPNDNGGDLIKFTIYMKEDDEFNCTKAKDILDLSVLEYTLRKSVDYGKNYTFLVTAWNKYGESMKDDVMAKTISIPQIKPTCETNTRGNAKTSIEDTSGKHSKFLIGVSVIAAILVVSLVLNVLQFLYIWKRIKPNEHGRNSFKETKTNKQEEVDQTYDNAMELSVNTSSSSGMKSGFSPKTTSAPEYEAVKLQQSPRRNQNPAKSIVYETPLPCESSKPSHYQELSPIDTAQDTKRPVYEPVRTRVPRNDNETNMYQPLGLRNESSDYQTLHAKGNDSFI
ncbi:hemicentin-1-like isoform X2 [Actinia tenebrosa]|uniref:Hemicentin-1-like isoform X2 n=1 Tax=Actinia tenebrosa TaxID=6105 RepID=A0A6P8IU40_ACTTE|nr:hemicentin-1-like isoform X2 [Actinia tenebrosa]